MGKRRESFDLVLTDKNRVTLNRLAWVFGVRETGGIIARSMALAVVAWDHLHDDGALHIVKRDGEILKINTRE
ncbi:MAG: hypothetical protein JSS66_19050 [Armatimonadetes bacterium]|nr:hypothetical protein [Armatimonadota bacterium]